MPRKKMIETPKIKIGKLDEEMIEKKDCLEVKLTLDTPFTSEQTDVLREFYKCSISDDGTTLSRKVQNSWSGLITLLVSVAYCKRRDSVVSNYWKCMNQQQDLSLRIDFYYERFFSDKEQTAVLNEAASAAVMSIDQFKDYFGSQGAREAIKQDMKNKRRQKYISILKNHAPDPAFQNVVAPKDWRPCYFSAKYTPRGIINSLDILSQMLGADKKQSIVVTEFSKQLPHKYQVHPAVYRDDTKWRIWN